MGSTMTTSDTGTVLSRVVMRSFVAHKVIRQFDHDQNTMPPDTLDIPY